MSSSEPIVKIVIDFIVLLCVTLPLIVITQVIEPYKRGYFEDDLTLRLPFKNDTVSETLCGVIGFAINVFTILAVEISRDRRGRNGGDKFLCNRLIPGWVWQTYINVGVFTFGAGCQQLVCEVTKVVIGRLRPHFFDVCKPIPVPNSPLNTLGYIQDFTCTNANAAQLRNMRLSFPSAHTGFAVYAAVYFVLYTQVRCKWRGSKLLRHGIQFAVALAGFYVGLSRVVDHMHHWSDVTVGLIIGSSFAVLVFIFVLKPKKYGSVDSWQEQPSVNVLPRPVLAGHRE